MLCQGNALCEDGNHGSKAIQEQRPGEDRVATNAATPQSTWWQDNQHALRRIVFRLQDATGVRANVVLLRPVEWLQTQNVRGGGTTWLDLAEMGICGAVNVVCIEPCPQIPSGPGRLITGWFEHFDAVVYDLLVTGEEEPLGVTATHPFWSVDRQAWISVIDLHIGERLQARDGTTPRVESLTLRSEREPVYNVEVEGDHCYRVGMQGLLVHNASAINIALGVYPGLRSFAEQYNAKYYLCWTREDFGVSDADAWDPNDLSGGTGSLFAKAVKVAIDKSNKIFFKLDGFDLKEWYRRWGQAGSSFPEGSVTAWELYLVALSPSYTARRSSVTFVRESTELNHEAFTKAVIASFEATAKQEKMDFPDWKTRRPKPPGMTSLNGLFGYTISQIEAL